MRAQGHRPPSCRPAWVVPSFVEHLPVVHGPALELVKEHASDNESGMKDSPDICISTRNQATVFRTYVDHMGLDASLLYIKG